MDIIPFVKKNDLWYVDMPELIVNNVIYNEPTFVLERNMIELLDSLAKKKLTQMNLEFHYEYINPYDAKLAKAYNSYKCISLFYRDKDLLLSFPPILSRAMKNNKNAKFIYLKVASLNF